MKRFDQEIQAPGIQFKKAERRTPDRAGNILIWLTFAGGAIVLYIICAAMICSRHEYMNWAGWLSVLTVIGVVVLVVIDREQIRTIETIIGRDLDGDGIIGPPPNTQITFHASERTSWMATLPAPPDLILEWGEAALTNRSLGYRQWQNRFALLPDGSDGALRYAAFRDAMVKSKLALEKGKHGISLTDRGIVEFTEFIAQRPDATPLLEG